MLHHTGRVHLAAKSDRAVVLDHMSTVVEVVVDHRKSAAVVVVHTPQVQGRLRQRPPVLGQMLVFSMLNPCVCSFCNLITLK